MTDYSELKKLAEKASPGPWWIDSHGMTMMSMPEMEVVFSHPAQSVAVRNEETGNLSHWRNDWDASYIATANPKTVLALIADCDSAHKHWANESNNVQAAVAEVVRLTAESESLRQDAERYRWLNRQRRSVWRELGAAPMNMTGELIDAAMGREAQELPGTLSEWAAADFNVKQMSREG